MEARVGIEPTHKGFADLSLTTWVPRQLHYYCGLLKSYVSDPGLLSFLPSKPL